jgi:hypothetical protein
MKLLDLLGIKAIPLAYTEFIGKRLLQECTT